MPPIDDVIGRLQEISNRISQIQRNAQLPPTLRARGVPEQSDDAASVRPAASTDAAGARSGATGATAGPADAARFQSLLDQALSISGSEAGTGDAAGLEATSLSLLDELVSAQAGDGSASGATRTPADQLQQYQQMIIESIRRASE